MTFDYGPWAVIAGGSDGTGAAFAHGIAARGVNLVLVARRLPVLEELAGALRARYSVEVRTVALDLSLPGAIDDLDDATADVEVGLFVYNAGADERSIPFLDRPVDEHLSMVRRNCESVLAAAHRFGAPMVSRRRGGFVIVTSGAAWCGGATLATYGATKAFDLLLAESLWAEWRGYGVDVLALVLGATDTPALRRQMAERGNSYGELSDPRDVAEAALEHLADGPTWIATGGDPSGGSPFGALSRRDAVLLMSQAATTH